MNMAFISGAVLVILLISTIIGAIVFRKVAQPKKQIYSTGVAFVVATIIAGYGIANGGEPTYHLSAKLYGIASIILLAIYLPAFYIQQKLRRKPETFS